MYEVGKDVPMNFIASAKIRLALFQLEYRNNIVLVFRFVGQHF